MKCVSLCSFLFILVVFSLLVCLSNIFGGLDEFGFAMHPLIYCMNHKEGLSVSEVHLLESGVLSKTMNHTQRWSNPFTVLRLTFTIDDHLSGHFVFGFRCRMQNPL